MELTSSFLCIHTVTHRVTYTSSRRKQAQTDLDKSDTNPDYCIRSFLTTFFTLSNVMRWWNSKESSVGRIITAAALFL